MKFENNLSPVD